jgi:hypothetical protein
MADFIAVIRRAVDGLSDNTPEMRAKVYERARSAVVRQLENMKPRPPEVMFQKQLDKLDAAIREVEQEHGEALPAEPAVVEDAPVEQAPEPEQVQAVQAEVAADVHTEQPVAEPEPARQESVDDFLEPAQEAPAPAPDQAPVEQELQAHEQPVEEAEAEPEAESQAAASYGDDTISSAPVVEDHHEDQVIATDPFRPEVRAESAQSQEVAAAPTNWAVDIDEEPQVVPPDEDESVVPMPKVSYDENDVVSGFNEFVQREMNRTVVPPPPKKAEKEEFSWDAPFDDLPEVTKPAAFEEALEAKQKELASQAATREAAAKAQPSAREELEDIIGFDREPTAVPQSASATATSDLPPDVARAVNKLEGKSFRHQKKKKKNRFNPMVIGLGVVGALVLGGGAYALWHYKDNVSAMVASIMPASDTAKPADKSKTDAKAVDTSTDKTATDKPADAANNTEVASLDTGPQKFTQRLMPDGTEADTSKSKLPVDQALKEGKNVFGQTEPGKDVTSAEAKTATDTGKPAAGTPALAATQKMFLYEERLGQTSPVAVPGTIVWSEKNETVEGKPEPTIEAQLDIPERKITALMTFKRNTDPSLPASHIIEIVFAIPKEFAEGNVESIQRVAFKQTEQDRGDALVAVPAKITDDFHMVALNDDAEARKANLELMKRAWIDIPITYRNGRRALITLEKGATGTAIFDKVLSEWSALGDQSAN